MKLSRLLNYAAAMLCAALLLAPRAALAEDIDIFLGNSGGSAATSNVLIILDNTSNWSANNQGWPGGITQGQAEVRAIKSVIANLDASVSVGLMLLTTASGNPGGMVVFGAKPMTAANIAVWNTWLDARFANITDSNWKAPADASYGAVMFDAFKYFGGYTNPLNANTNVAGSPVSATRYGPERYAAIPASQVDSTAYNTAKTSYISPSSSDCSKNYIIFIGNGFPNADVTSLLSNVGGDITPITPNTMDGGSRIYTADEWARFLNLTDVNATPGQQNVITFTLNVYGPSAQPAGVAIQTNYLGNMASKGGGKAYTAQSSAQVISALETVFAEISGVNSTFASASLPVNTTNRSQDKNQVFIPMFRPNSRANPRWAGNLKQYQFIKVSGSVELGDSLGQQAVSSTTGFPTDCATSYWTTDSGAYWSSVASDISLVGKCPASVTSFNVYSDSPDGPMVEKGGAAEVLRKGNNPPSTNTTPTYAVNRTLYTQSSAGLVTFNPGVSGLSAAIVDYTRGHDSNDENGNSNMTETRSSIHGDTIHSQPLPIDYGGTTGVTVYYGSNDGVYRAIDSTTGRERWGFIAPEFFTGTKLERLKNNSPQILNYFSASSAAAVTPTPTAKDYFFDGSTGVYQSVSNTVWIYPTMRRGGRMIYALDVTAPESPSYKWKIGCPNLTDDTGCTAGMTGIGQTWSRPNVAPSLPGYNAPVLIVGGGYDTCEDANTATPSCATPKGAGVHVIDANTGAIVKSFSTTRSVVADIALIAIATAGTPDYAYAVDTGGNIYRINFSSTVAGWSINRVAFTNGSGRKFFYTPAVLAGPNNKVYIALGSGDREHPLQSQYPYLNVTNRAYVYVDDLGGTAPTNLDCVQGASGCTTYLRDFTTASTCQTTGVLPSSVEKGWFMDLRANGLGEQTVTSAIIAAGMVTFSTNRPVPSAAGTCATTLGEARGYWLNLFNGSGGVGVPGSCGGSRSSVFVGGGLPPSPVLGVVPIDGVATTVLIGAARKDGTSSSAISPQMVNPGVSSRRKTVYWKSSGEN